MKNIGTYILTAVKGVCMGAADVIPGVSGGTIAFMMGIYDKLLASISSINTEAFRLVFKGDFKAFWKHINGSFLLSLIIGIGFSILSLAKVMTYLLAHHPIQTWAFFFGLIVASSIFILKDIENWDVQSGLMLVAGIVLGVIICTLSPTQTPDALWFIFLCGAIAICAMILPGISGSFILLILGKYEFIMGTINELTAGVNVGHNLGVLAIFAIGAVIGIISFSKFLHWLMGKWHKETLLVLAGFIIGSLVKVWPWSNTEAIVKSQFMDELTRANDIVLSGSTLDAAIARLEAQIDPQYGTAILFALIGFFLVTGIELAAKKFSKAKGE